MASMSTELGLLGSQDLQSLASLPSSVPHHFLVSMPPFLRDVLCLSQLLSLSFFLQGLPGPTFSSCLLRAYPSLGRPFSSTAPTPVLLQHWLWTLFALAVTHILPWTVVVYTKYLLFLSLLALPLTTVWQVPNEDSGQVTWLLWPPRYRCTV